MQGIQFLLPYIGSVYLKPQIFTSTQPCMIKGEHYFNLNNYSAALNSYKKSLLYEQDSIEVRNNIAACLLIFGDQNQAFRIFLKLKSPNLISLYNIGLSSACVKEPKEGLNVLDFHIENPLFNLLKGILYHQLGDSIKAFKFFSAYKSEKVSEIEGILENMQKKVELNEKTISFSRGKEKVYQGVKSYLQNFFAKFSKSTSNLLASEVKQENLRILPNFKQKKRTKKLTVSTSMVLQNDKLLVKRMNIPNKKPDDLSQTLLSPGFKCKNVTKTKSFFDVGRPKRINLNKNISELKIEIDVNLDNYEKLPQQSLAYIASEYNKPTKNIEGLFMLLKNLHFFAKHKPKIVKEFIRVSRYERFLKDDIILKEGDLGNFIYVIISGAVIVCKENPEGKERIIVNSIYDGHVLGEYSFIRKVLDAKPSFRGATCVASELCHLIRISNSDISDIIEKYADLKNEVLEFIKSLPLFKNITPVDLALLANTITCKQFDMNVCLLRSGEVPENMFIVYRGRVKLKYPAKKMKYSKVLNAVQNYTVIKELWISSGTYFGQRALFGKKTPANYSVFSDHISYTTLIFISKEDFQQLFYPIQQHLLALLAKAPELDIKVPEEYDYMM